MDHPSFKTSSEESWIHPGAAANPVAKLMAMWISPLIHLASKKSLTDDDVWECPKDQNVQHDSKLVWNNWLEEKKLAEIEHREPSLLRSICRGFGSEILLSGAFQFLFMSLQLCQPYLVGELGM